jgi:hypothetical protein
MHIQISHVHLLACHRRFSSQVSRLHIFFSFAQKLTSPSHLRLSACRIVSSVLKEFSVSVSTRGKNPPAILREAGELKRCGNGAPPAARHPRRYHLRGRPPHQPHPRPRRRPQHLSKGKKQIERVHGNFTSFVPKTQTKPFTVPRHSSVGLLASVVERNDFCDVPCSASSASLLCFVGIQESRVLSDACRS